MEDFDLDSEYEKVIELLNSDEFYRLKEKFEKKMFLKKNIKYIIYNRLNIIRENIAFLNNIMNYINYMRHKIREIQNERELRKKYREDQGQEKKLNTQIKNEESEIKALENTLLLEQLDEEEKAYIREEIEKSSRKIKEIQDKITEIKQKVTEYEIIEKKYPITHEEQMKIILELQEKINQCSIVAEKLIKGHTLEEALEYLMTWQRKRYKLEKKDDYTIHKDIEQIRSDKEIGNEIVKIAYHYDEIQGKDR